MSVDVCLSVQVGTIVPMFVRRTGVYSVGMYDDDGAMTMTMTMSSDVRLCRCTVVCGLRTGVPRWWSGARWAVCNGAMMCDDDGAYDRCDTVDVRILRAPSPGCRRLCTSYGGVCGVSRRPVQRRSGVSVCDDLSSVHAVASVRLVVRVRRHVVVRVCACMYGERASALRVCARLRRASATARPSSYVAVGVLRARCGCRIQRVGVVRRTSSSVPSYGVRVCCGGDGSVRCAMVPRRRPGGVWCVVVVVYDVYVCAVLRLRRTGVRREGGRAGCVCVRVGVRWWWLLLSASTCGGVVVRVCVARARVACRARAYD